MTHGASLAPEPHLLHPPFAADIVRRLLLAAHLLGILVNLLLRKFDALTFDACTFDTQLE